MDFTYLWASASTKDQQDATNNSVSLCIGQIVSIIVPKVIVVKTAISLFKMSDCDAPPPQKGWFLAKLHSSDPP